MFANIFFYRLTSARQNGSSEAEAEFNAQIAKIVADIERVAPNMKAMDRCVQFKAHLISDTEIPLGLMTLRTNS